MNLNPTQNRIASRARRCAFTLIELLVVIAIIGMLAAMIANLAAPSSIARKRKLMDAAKEQLITAIENYKAKIGFYPPDNALLSDLSKVTDYSLTTARNPLLYELTGPRVDVDANDLPTNFQLFNSTNASPSDLETVYGRKGLANSSSMNTSDQRSFNFLIPTPNPTQYKSYPENKDTLGLNQILGLVVPVSLDRYPANPAVQTPPDFVNFWHYDASSANRHNMDSYDVWAVYSLGKNIVTNGNWIQQ